MTASDTAPAGPLSRFTVIDLSRVRAGPNAVRQLSDWGARVIKVESPSEDDMTGSRDGYDFQNLHRNKQAITLDLKRPEGVAVLMKLLRTADVVVENFRPDVKHRLGVDYDAVRAINPGIVYASISGFGQTGPYRDRPGFDTIAQGMGGLMSVTGEPGRGPQRAGIPIADLCSGLFCAIGILIALLDRDVTGKGQWVHTSLLQAQISMLDFQAAHWLIGGVVPGQTGSNHPYMTPMGVFPTSDGHIVIGASGQEQYRRFTGAMAVDVLATDPRFATVESRAENVKSFVDTISEHTRKRPSAHWVELFNGAGVACGPIYAIDEVFEDPQVKQYGMVKPVRHERLGALNVLGSPIMMSDRQSVIRTASPERGEHTEEILRAFGFTADDIAKLRADRVAL
jgi:crotonobetainyl-CoA:carnitine CoA-transferase CaiB-like acyl-CoA transferase